ncbi:MAG: hypothetical protein N3E36_06910 [Sulfolobales archaeon]|nr:hypothetical protein [Ignisphaera sp.]MCX8199724.1 hypothetical protein [Sulfolobales archaeon]MDW8085857.1 hypothetical protein [Ignisphaera sp.]
MIHIALASLILSLASIVVVALLYRDVRHIATNLINEFGLALTIRKRYRRMKRYILAKVVCLDNIDAKKLGEDIEKAVNSFLGHVVKLDCSLTLLSFRSDLNRAIFRVVGSSACVKYSLVALSLHHLASGSCIVIPIRTSGLLSRVRRFVGYKR